MSTKIESNVNKVLTTIAEEISGTIGVSLVELESGIPMGSVSKKQGFDLNIAAAYNAEVVKQKMKALNALKQKDEKLNEFIITLTNQVHMIMFVGSTHIVYFAADKSSNMGLMRTVINRELPALQAALN